MSYAEHGPRIFLANKSNAGTPLIYGDYVLPKKRLEGRLKLYDSCSDIRAWSPNYLENSRYFRELNEHGSPVIGKIIPFNVVIDNIIQLNSQAQNELQMVKKELQKYKNLKLSSKQEQQLQSLENKQVTKESIQNDSCTSLLKDTFVNISKSVPIINSNSCLSIHIPFKRHFQNDTKSKSTLRNPSNEVCSCSLTAFDSSLNNLVPSFRSIKPFLTEDFNEKPSPCIECIDVAIQVEMDTCSVEKINKSLTKSVMSQTSFTYKFSDEDNSMTELDSSSLQTNNDKEESFECDASCSESSQNIETPTEFYTDVQPESDFDLHQRIHKGIIIQTESKIIALEHELCVRDADLKELQDVKKDLETSLQEKEDYIKTQQEYLKMLSDKMLKLHHQHNYEAESLKEQIHDYKCLIEQLQQDLRDKSEICHLQSQEIGKLQLSVKDVAILQLEKNAYIKKLEEMEQSVKKAETCNLALKQIKTILQEKDELKKQNYEQCCILVDQEEEINELLNLIKEISIAYEEQKKTKTILEELKSEVHNKDIKISQYEKQLLSMRQEISDFFNNLKHALNNLEELNGLCEDVCNCTNCDLDINEEANNVLQNINTIMTRFQSYKIESQNLVQQIEELKQSIGNHKQQIHLDQNLRNMINENLCVEHDYDESDINLKNPSGEDIIVLSIEQNKSSTNGTGIEDISNSVNSENSLQTTSNILDFSKQKAEYDNYIIQLNKTTDIEKVEKEIIEYFSRSIFKLYFLTQQLKVYLDTERPFVIKLIYNFCEILENIQSAVNISQDVTLKKQRISKLYSQHKEEHTKYNSSAEEIPTDLLKIQNKMNEFIEVILYHLLNEILRTEEESLHNRQINHALEMYFKSCIDRVNNTLQDAEDQRIQMVEEIEKQQRELQEKDTEIARLKKEVAQQIERRGEGDCLNQKVLEKSITIEQQLSKVTAELSNKNALVSELKDKLQVFENELLEYKKNCITLKKTNNNIKNNLTKERKQAEERLAKETMVVKNLSQKLHKLSKIKDSNTVMSNELTRIKKVLLDTQNEKSKLQEQITQINTIISKKDQALMDLKNSTERKESIFTREMIEHENVVKEKNDEIVKLENENKLLSEKLKDTENKCIKMNQTITSLTEQNDKINILYMMQEKLEKLDKNEKRLKAELNTLKVQLINDQNNNKKLESNLDTFLRENDNLEKCVEYWKNENSELSIKLYNEITDENLKSQLYVLSNKILERLSALKKQETANYINRDLRLKSTNQESEIKENEIEEVELQELLNTASIKRNSCTTFKQFESIENNSSKMKYKTISLENEHYDNQNETKDLLNEIEISNCKIRNYMEIIERLRQENMGLRAALKSQAEKYQNKLTLMKRNYDSSLNALNERHKESIEILQKQFEDNLKSEKMFDSEHWLQSLNMKELMELYERITIIYNSNLMCEKSKNQSFYESDGNKEFYTGINIVGDKLQMTPKNIYERELTNLQLQKQWPLTILNDVQNYSTLQRRSDIPRTEHGIRYRYREEKPSELEDKYEKEKQVEKDSTFDQQRWNFINQCSAYHKLSNTYEHSRTYHTD